MEKYRNFCRSREIGKVLKRKSGDANHAREISNPRLAYGRAAGVAHAVHAAIRAIVRETC